MFHAMTASLSSHGKHAGSHAKCTYYLAFYVLTNQMAYAGLPWSTSFASCNATTCAGSIGGQCSIGGFITDRTNPYTDEGTELFVTLLVPNGISAV